jgi:hypothetical protein
MNEQQQAKRIAAILGVHVGGTNPYMEDWPNLPGTIDKMIDRLAADDWGVCIGKGYVQVDSMESADDICHHVTKHYNQGGLAEVFLQVYGEE